MGVAQRYGSTKCHYLVHVKMNGEKVNFTLCEFHFVKKEEVGERENVGVKQQGRDWTLLLACEVEEGAASRGTGGASPSEWGRRGSGCSPDTSENECSPASTSTAAQRDLCWNCNYRTVTRYICIVSRHRTQTYIYTHTPRTLILAFLSSKKFFFLNLSVLSFPIYTVSRNHHRTVHHAQNSLCSPSVVTHSPPLLPGNHGFIPHCYIFFLFQNILALFQISGGGAFP